MKKIILIAVGMAIGLVLAKAQNDTTNSNSGAPLQSAGLQPNQYKKQDRVLVKPADVPTLLKQTLNENDDYRGWERSAMYRDKNTDTYFFNLLSNGTAKIFYFDQNGKPISGDSRTSPSYNSSGDPNKP